MIRRILLLVGISLLALPLAQALWESEIAPGGIVDTLFQVSLLPLALWAGLTIGDAVRKVRK